MAQQPKSYKKFVATAATATLVASAIVPVASANVSTSAFTDVPASYKDAVDFVVTNNISAGLTATSYGINAQIKRVDAAVMIAAAAGMNDKDAPSSGFKDVPSRAAVAVNSLKAAGIVNGKSTTHFGAQDNITRGEAAIMLQKAFELKSGESKNSFTDVSNRYDDAVDALVAHGVTNGINKTQFGTGNPIKRGDFAKFLYALKDKIEPIDPEAPVVEGNRLVLTASKDSITADGGDNTVITAKIVDENGVVAKDADDLVLKFDATYGQLANNRVTVQDGVATVVLTSEFSKSTLNSIVTARLIEAAPDSKWNDEIGKLVSTTTVKFTPASGTVSQTALITGAESNMADRLTVFFDKDVTPATFLGDNPLRLTVNQDNNKTIVGYKAVPNNSKAIEVVLAKNTPLANNKTVTVGQVTKEGTVNSRSFILTDARQPEATSVTQTAYNELEVTFSEPIQDVQKQQILIDGGTVSIKSVMNGEFDQDTGDMRNKLIVTTDRFIKAGKHSIQLSGIKDFANNESTNQILDFTVQGSDVIPAATAKVESPEQFRVNFNTFVEGFNPADLKLEVYNEDAKEWVPAVAGAVTNLKKTPEFKVTSYAQNSTYTQNVEYLYELTEDWTQLFDTKNTNDNYYNHQFRFVLDKDKVENPANEKKNFKQEINLSYSGSALATPDTTSPKLVGTPTQITKGDEKGYFDVRFDKPVKDRDLDPGLNTPSQLQGTTIPKVVVEFIGTDKDGKKITVGGTVVRYADKMENGFIVKPDRNLQTQVDEAGFAEDWELVVRNVTDDVGNAASTLTQKFTVVKSPAATLFAVKTDLYDGVDFYLNGAGEDQVVLNFTSAVQYTGNTENALNASNYTLNGKELPKGTKFTLADSNNNLKDGYEKVTITLPDGTLNTNSNVINLSKGLKSANGVAISGITEIAKAPKDKAPGSDVADKTALNAAIADAKTKVEADYTAASWTTFKNALTAAEATAAKANATEAEVTAATTALKNAQAALQTKPGEGAVVLSTITDNIADNNFGAYAIAITKEQLTGSLKDATGLKLVVKGKTYTASKYKENFVISVPTDDATIEEVKAGLLSAQ